MKKERRKEGKQTVMVLKWVEVKLRIFTSIKKYQTVLRSVILYESELRTMKKSTISSKG